MTPSSSRPDISIRHRDVQQKQQADHTDLQENPNKTMTDAPRPSHMKQQQQRATFAADAPAAGKYVCTQNKS
jgi:hypothetical protein